MPEDPLIDRLEQLESRLMHLEAGLEELTRTLLELERTGQLTAEVVRQLESRIQDLANRPATPPVDPPPPHY